MVYIHIPFCIKKCLYCDFYSVTEKNAVKEYTDALIEEIKKYKGEKTETVYIGGGTPTSIGGELLRIVDAAMESFVLAKDYEFTVEANPGAADRELFEELFKKGVNRISLGAQSFVDDELKSLGRIHCANDIFAAAEMIKQAGFKNFSIDLMFAIPNQTTESLLYSLDCIKKINPTHISVYSLIVEEGTPFYDMDLNIADEDTERDMYDIIEKVLLEQGFKRYEISNYAKDSFESRHNTGYWKCKEYIGLGAGAHSYRNNQRYENAPDISLYIQGKGRKINICEIDEKEKQAERFMLGLRMVEGVEYNGEFKGQVATLTEKGLLEITDGRLRLTKRGTDLANLVFMEFLND